MNNPRRKLFLLSPTASVIALLVALLSAGIVPIVLKNYGVDIEVANAVRTILYIILGIMLGGIVLQYLFIYLEPVRAAEKDAGVKLDSKGKTKKLTNR